MMGHPLAIELENWVLAEALEQQARWQAEGLRLKMHINVTAADISPSQFLSRLESEIARTGCDVVDCFTLEILESAAMSDVQRVNAVISACTEMGEVVEVVVAKREVDVPPLAAAPRTLARAGLPPAAYIHLRSFTVSAESALDDAFAELADQGITDFIIDLRYNSGGLVDVASRFMDLLGGEIAEGEVAFSISHNDKRVSENEDISFAKRPATASPIRIAFITSESTASASELLINSLAPFAEIVLVGSDTSGKAVGQYAFDQRGCDTRLRLVSFESVNGEGFGGFYTGLVDTGRFTLCAVQDNFTGAFGAPEEALTEGALAWLNEGVCPTNVGITSTGRRTLRRGPPPIAGVDRPDRRSTWLQ